jgi:hypothetical protein
VTASAVHCGPVEAVVVVLAAAVCGLLVVKSLDRYEPPPVDLAPRHELALVPRPDGRWERATRPPEGSLTVTLVVPWEEVAERYAGVNVVVR